MNNNLFTKIVPDNIQGKAVDIEQSVTSGTREEAIDTFKRACKRLLNVKIWHTLSGFGSAEFKLVDATGHTIHKLTETGDFFQIDLPGPGPVSGDGYDWVKVEMIEDNSNPDGERESFGMMVRACAKPGTANEDAAHFFTSDATSSFIIERENNTVTTYYYGRNEIHNTGVKSIADKVRNAVTSTFALLGISEMQWKSLIKAFVEKEL